MSQKISVGLLDVSCSLMEVDIDASPPTQPVKDFLVLLN